MPQFTFKTRRFVGLVFFYEWQIILFFQVFETTAADLEADLNRRTGGGGDGGEIGEDAVVKLRGLPFSASKMDIVDFFKAVLRIRIRIHMFLGLPDPDSLVIGMDPDTDPSINKQI